MPAETSSSAGGIEPEDHAEASRDAEADRRDSEERAALWHANEQRRVLVDTCPLAIISMDRSGVVTEWSPAAERIFGWTRDEAVGARLPFVPDDDATFPTNLRLSIEGQATHGVEARRRRRDGEIIDITFWATPVRDVDGNVQAITAVIADVTDRKRAEAALRQNDERYRTFIAQSSEGIWRFEVHPPISIDAPVEEQIEAIFDHAYLAECNDAMARMYGLTRASEILGVGVGEFLDREDPRNTEYLLAFIKSGYRLTDAESHERDRDGNPKVFLNNLIGIIEGRELARAWGTQRDITERKRLEVQIKRTADELAEANRRKDEFLAMLAHELRNPLAPIMNAAGILRLRAGADPVVSRQRDLVERNARHLARLVDDLLEVSRINEGKITLHKEKVDLASVVEQAVASIQPAIQGRRHELAVNVPPHPVVVDADPTRLVQVLVNVLHNAAKYTDAGGHIALSLERRRRGDEEGPPALDEAVVAICDNGRGIEPDLLPQIFDLFVQGRQTLARTEGGLGIGLTLARRIMDMHGGAITAVSEGAGRGSVFEVRMPIHEDRAQVDARDPEPRARAGSASARPEASASRRVLIIEDNVDAAETLAELLALWGHDSRVAPDGETGLELARVYAPEIVLLDLGLPGIDGYEVARRLRGAKSQAQRVIALTGYGDEEARQRAARSGFDHHLRKPVDPEALRALLAS